MEKGFQLCPKCNGTGKIYNEQPLTGNPMVDFNILASNGLVRILELRGAKNECLVCKGKMIISTETGKPPID